MASEHFTVELPQTLDQAFPDVVCPARPLGNRVMVQVRRQPNVTKSGLVLVEETKETVKWNMQIARIVDMGPIAYCNRETGLPWPEGKWVRVGDYVRVPRWGGDRIEVPVQGATHGHKEEPVTFVCFNDHELISVVEGDPLAIKTYIL